MLNSLIIVICLNFIQINLTDEARIVDTFLANTTDKCWTLDRISDKNLVSVSATGTGFYAYAVAYKLGRLSKEEAVNFIRTGFDNILKYNQGYDGWLLHFMDKDGKAANDTEISSIDTVLFYASVEK